MRSMATATSTKPGAVELRRDLGLADLTLTQVLFIVGLPWVGVAAKQGPAHVLFWLAAIALFYLPSAAVVILTVFKVFLIDMSDLTGIYQSLSFIGLGIVLLGVGWLYQRLLFPRRAPTAPSPA